VAEEQKMRAQFALKKMTGMLPAVAEALKKRARSAFMKEMEKKRAAVAAAAIRRAQKALTKKMGLRSLPVPVVEEVANNSTVVLHEKTSGRK